MDMDEVELSRSIIAYVALQQTLLQQNPAVQELEQHVAALTAEYNEALEIFHEQAENDNPNLEVWRLNGQRLNFLRARILEHSTMIQETTQDAAAALTEARALHYTNMLASHTLEVNSVQTAAIAIELVQVYQWDGNIWVDEDVPVNIEIQVRHMLGVAQVPLLN